MPRPVSDTIAGGLPLWDTYEALFFLLTGAFLGLILGFLFPSLWRSFRRRFRKTDRFKPDRLSSGQLIERSGLLQPDKLQNLNEEDDNQTEQSIGSLFVAARYAVQESAYREAVALYLQILGSESVSRVQTNKAMFELSQVYALSSLPLKAFETGVELLHRKPAHTDLFRFLLHQLKDNFDEERLEQLVKVYAGPSSADLSREVSHMLASASSKCLVTRSESARQSAIRFAKLAVRWSPTAIEPKIALVQATSLLWSTEKDRPADQLFIGFCVDMTELALMRRQFPQLSPLSVETFLEAWVSELAKFGTELENSIQKMKAEILAVFKIEKRAQSSSPVYDLSFVWTVFSRLKKRAASRNQVNGTFPNPLSWEKQLQELLGWENLDDRNCEVHQCSQCGEVQREFSWQCKSCNSWESLGVWSANC